MKNQNSLSDRYSRLAVLVDASAAETYNVSGLASEIDFVSIHVVTYLEDTVAIESISEQDVEKPIYVAFLYWSSEERRRFEKFCKNYTDADLLSHVEMTQLNFDNPLYSFLIAVARRISEEHLKITLLASEQLKSLAALRRSYEIQHDKFSKLEELIQHAPSILYRDKFRSYPSDKKPPVIVELAASPLIQPLPVGSKGICAIEVYFSIKSIRSNGSINIRLMAEDVVLSSWQVPELRIRQNQESSLLLIISRSLGGPSKDVSLVVEDVTKSEVVINFQPTGPVSNRALRPCNRGGVPYSDGMLPLRIWDAPPGLNVPSIPGAYSSETPQIRSAATVLLPNFAVAHAKHSNIFQWKEAFKAVQFLEDNSELLVHPPQSGTTVAVINGALYGSCKYISALAISAHENAQPIEFCLVVARPDYKIDFDLLNPNSRYYVMSDWIALAGGTHSHLGLALRPIFDNDVILDLYLLTRMSHGSTNAYAWARFKDICIEYTDLT